jgi:hypothetical protein
MHKNDGIKTFETLSEHKKNFEKFPTKYKPPIYINKYIFNGNRISEDTKKGKKIKEIQEWFSQISIYEEKVKDIVNNHIPINFLIEHFLTNQPLDTILSPDDFKTISNKSEEALSKTSSEERPIIKKHEADSMSQILIDFWPKSLIRFWNEIINRSIYTIADIFDSKSNTPLKIFKDVNIFADDSAFSPVRQVNIDLSMEEEKKELSMEQEEEEISSEEMTETNAKDTIERLLSKKGNKTKEERKKLNEAVAFIGSTIKEERNKRKKRLKAI